MAPNPTKKPKTDNGIQIKEMEDDQSTLKQVSPLQIHSDTHTQIHNAASMKIEISESSPNQIYSVAPVVPNKIIVTPNFYVDTDK